MIRCKINIRQTIGFLEIRLYECCHFLLFHRKLVNESMATFLSLQNLMKDDSGSVTSDQMVKISRQYRSVLRDCQVTFVIFHVNCSFKQGYIKSKFDIFPLTFIQFSNFFSQIIISAPRNMLF